jgi:hypothetical protein
MANVPEGAGETLELAALKTDGPKALLARTLNVYAVQLVSPVTVTGDIVPVPVILPGDDKAV